MLAQAARQVQAAAALDPGLAELSGRLEALQYEAQDVGAELRAYVLGVDGDAAGAPARLEQVEERLALLARLERKHGGSLAEVLAHAERCRARREELAGADDALERVQGELAGARS